MNSVYDSAHTSRIVLFPGNSHTTAGIKEQTLELRWLSLHSNPLTMVELESASGSSSSSSAKCLLGSVRNMNGLLGCKTIPQITKYTGSECAL